MITYEVIISKRLCMIRTTPKVPSNLQVAKDDNGKKLRMKLPGGSFPEFDQKKVTDSCQTVRHLSV